MAQPPANDNAAQYEALKQQLIQSTQSGGGGKSFIGLPSQSTNLQGSLADVPQGQVAPRYYEGAQYLPVMLNSTPQEIATLQGRLVNAGLLANTDFRGGVWDAPSQKAFMDVLGLANASGSDWQTALGQYEQGSPMTWDSKTNSYVKAGPGTSLTNAKVVTRFTAPDDLAAAAQEVATSRLGRSFTPDELQRFVRAYHGSEAGESAGQAAASGVSGGGFTAAASPAVAADTFAKQTDPTAYNAEQFLPLVQKMNDLLAGPGLATTKPMSA
jgi:hypothetical protein